ncbi:MAG: hypothetical protein AAF483_18855 [Planctomycetota bacterium]
MNQIFEKLDRQQIDSKETANWKASMILQAEAASDYIPLIAAAVNGIDPSKHLGNYEMEAKWMRLALESGDAELKAKVQEFSESHDCLLRKRALEVLEEMEQ